MAPTRPRRIPTDGLEQIRAQFLTALHCGQLCPGDRVPSVRSLADQTGMNRKTVHRAYRRLAREGLLELRPGSGTFLVEVRAGSAGRPVTGELLLAANRSRAEAAALGLAPEMFAGFLQCYLGGGLRGVPLAVVECNAEQVGLIGRELRTELGVAPHPLLLSALAERAQEAELGVQGIVTTDCHRAEVCSLAPAGAPVYCVALDSAFPKLLAEHARRGPVIMVVRDRTYAPVFLRLLRQMAVPSGDLDRFRIVEPPDARAALEEVGAGAVLYVSPLVGARIEALLPQGLRRVEFRRHLAADSLRRLRARLALDVARSGIRPPRGHGGRWLDSRVEDAARESRAD